MPVAPVAPVSPFSPCGTTAHMVDTGAEMETETRIAIITPATNMPIETPVFSNHFHLLSGLRIVGAIVLWAVIYSAWSVHHGTPFSGLLDVSGGSSPEKMNLRVQKHPNKLTNGAECGI